MLVKRISKQTLKQNHMWKGETMVTTLHRRYRSSVPDDDMDDEDMDATWAGLIKRQTPKFLADVLVRKEVPSVFLEYRGKYPLRYNELFLDADLWVDKSATERHEIYKSYYESYRKTGLKNIDIAHKGPLRQSTRGGRPPRPYFPAFECDHGLDEHTLEMEYGYINFVLTHMQPSSVKIPLSLREGMVYLGREQIKSTVSDKSLQESMLHALRTQFGAYRTKEYIKTRLNHKLITNTSFMCYISGTRYSASESSPSEITVRSPDMVMVKSSLKYAQNMRMQAIDMKTKDLYIKSQKDGEGFYDQEDRQRIKKRRLQEAASSAAIVVSL